MKSEALVGEVVWPSALIVSGRTRSETQIYQTPKPVFIPLHPPSRRRNHKEGDFGTAPRRGSRVLILTQQTCPLLEPWFPHLPKEGETRGSGRLLQNSCSGSPGSWVSPVLCSLPRHKVHRGELHQIKGSRWPPVLLQPICHPALWLPTQWWPPPFQRHPSRDPKQQREPHLLWEPGQGAPTHPSSFRGSLFPSFTLSQHLHPLHEEQGLGLPRHGIPTGGFSRLGEGAGPTARQPDLCAVSQPTVRWQLCVRKVGRSHYSF